MNNTKRVRSGRATGTDTGNYYYAKIEAKSRKTDPFMALVASMVIEPALGSGMVANLPDVSAIAFNFRGKEVKLWRSGFSKKAHKPKGKRKK